MLWDFDFRDGALGGSLVRGPVQGKSAAILVRKILAGQPAAAFPVRDGPAEPVLDYTVMRNFGISPSDAPKGTLFAHEPASLYERHKLVIWSVLAALFVSLPASAWLALILTSRRRAEARLAESERRYRQLVESARALILRFDQTGRLIFVNEYAEKLLGYNRQELLEGAISFWPSAPANLSGLLARAMTAPELLSGDVRENAVTTKDGRRIWIHWDNQPIAGEGGRPEGWLAVGTDVTARCRAEEALAARALAEEEVSAFGRELLTDAPGAVLRALRRLVSAFGAVRAIWYANVDDPEQGLCCRVASEAMIGGYLPAADNPAVYQMAFSIDGFQFADAMLAGNVVSGVPAEFPTAVREALEHLGCSAFMAAPVTTNGAWSGFLVVGEGRVQRRFTRQEQTLLSTAASLLSAHLSRPRNGDC